MKPYEIDLDALYEGGNKTVTWHGRTCWKNPCDLIIYAEIVQEVAPVLVIETGTHQGGSALFWRDMMALFSHGGAVVTVDVAELGVPEAAGITSLRGSSTDATIVDYARERAETCAGPVLVNIDSDHNTKHVYAELEAYGPLVTPGSYMIVEDGVDDFRWNRRGPHDATLRFLADHSEFEPDRHRERLGLTNCPSGFLRRVS